jgi:SAM-dependent methyltransferase
LTPRHDTVWQSAQIARHFLDNTRGGIPLAAEQIDVMLRVIRAALPRVERFLDLGCGDGVLGRVLLTKYPAAQGVFLDFSQPMLDAAKSKLGDSHKHAVLMQDYGTRDWLKAVEAYAPFDAVISGYSIHHQPDGRKRELYAEIFDLLKPGGVFLNMEHVSSPTPWIEKVSDDLLVDTIYGYAKARGLDKTREQVAEEFHSRPDKIANILESVETQCQWLRAIGYQHVDCFIKIFELAVFGGMRP